MFHTFVIKVDSLQCCKGTKSCRHDLELDKTMPNLNPSFLLSIQQYIQILNFQVNKFLSYYNTHRQEITLYLGFKQWKLILEKAL